MILPTEQNELRSQIDALQSKIVRLVWLFRFPPHLPHRPNFRSFSQNDIKNKISTTSVKGGPHHERKIELRKQLDEVRNEQQKMRGGRGKTVEQLSTMQEQLKKKVQS